MPRRTVTLERWQLGLSLLLLTLSFVVAVALVNRESRMRSSQNRHLILEQQIQRAEITYSTCLDQNGRHDATIKRLDEIIEKAVAADPARAKQIRASRSSTVFIIEALAPHQNCKQLVLDRFGFVPQIGG